MLDLSQHLINAVAAGTIYALVALGYTMVYGVLKLINFAHGDVMMVGVYVGYAVAFLLGREAASSLLGVLAVFLVAMLVCAVLGFLIERFAYRPLREKPRLTALITAIGISFTISYGFQLDLTVGQARDAVTGVEARQLSSTPCATGSDCVTLLPGAAARRFPTIIESREWLKVSNADETSEVRLLNWQVLSFLIAVGLMVALQVLVYRTKFGKAMRAVSHDHRTAALLGIPVDTVIAGTFMLGSALAAGAGILYAIKDKQVQPLMGMYVGLKAFVAAVIGGIGNLQGAVAGALLLGLCEEAVVWFGSSSWRDAVAFGFLIVVLLFRPAGLFGRVVAEKV
ncbi:MAG: branched-chain amino acid ABC transporter permease [Myxococcaceae bacterium]|nr:branched-chain amino acid ABC transporter permease [Myxococcaceae bacterium]MCA3015629.1 branched-chain amino acid ABC transporter permease [Myxococcaceae bacterium]